MLKSQRLAAGFTLIELLVALSIAAVSTLAALTLHSELWRNAWQQQAQGESEQGFYALGHWLYRELRRHGGGHLWQFDPRSSCLLFADNGVRLRNGALQWKPEHGDCGSSGWLNLHDPALFKINHFFVDQPTPDTRKLCLELLHSGELPTLWCYSWRSNG
ncbi:MAG: prepilin-type N-terminal cleavage/methylation domain-containing protein [Aliidiomarina sp.]|uniref:prepilin-type N-terminal cleavage/methylation domain-containing protein n=1 Tax=Aliidiomarina sp. TaxID=1872439 RepID=UPI0025BC1849|nr:prepilin-type N-terminal cleavage/methylation domain-containing protein [Aliidiomarina sp.]MCH8502237.1 prepilin-type N-terminal cleavage/methylation domain-containing protein [Aliidiomarina sp.]